MGTVHGISMHSVLKNPSVATEITFVSTSPRTNYIILGQFWLFYSFLIPLSKCLSCSLYHLTIADTRFEGPRT
jgi:hypothetical protein